MLYCAPNVLEDVQAAVTQQNQAAFTRFCENTSRTELYGKKAVKINATRYKLFSNLAVPWVAFLQWCSGLSCWSMYISQVAQEFSYLFCRQVWISGYICGDIMTEIISIELQLHLLTGTQEGFWMDRSRWQVIHKWSEESSWMTEVLLTKVSSNLWSVQSSICPHLWICVFISCTRLNMLM